MSSPVRAAEEASVSCPVTQSELRTAVNRAATADSTGLNNHFWAVAVNRSGTVCAVAFSGATVYSQWLLSRQIAAAKAFTANGLSLDAPKGPLSTAQLYGFVQPSPSGGNPLFGLEGGNVLDSNAAFAGDVSTFGTVNDPMVGKRVGGTITFGGGLALYRGNTAIGGVGVSGDTACADHSVAWRIRTSLGLVPPSLTDTITLSSSATPTTGGHPRCPNDSGTQGQTATN
ncbi:heme-binding protein [Methylorubrum sp. SB2]|uniref:heme-binding protein n=1 Tax=Methylorubrum subtropicum TaxID=3138812 RepID=UPI00313E4C3B